MPHLKQTALSYLALGLGICTIAFSSLFVRWAHAPGPVIGFYRMGLAALFMTPFLYPRKMDYAHIERKAWVFPVIGGLCMAGDLALWNSSLSYTSIAHSTLLGNTSPLWVAIIAGSLLGERLTGRFWTGLAFTMAGAVLVMGGDFFLHPQLGRGDGLAAASAVFYAGYYLAAQYGRQRMKTLPYMVCLDLVSGGALLVISLVLGNPIGGYPLESFVFFVAQAFVVQVIGHLAIGYSLGHLPASIVSATLLLQPVASALLAIPFFGERLQPLTILGGLMVLGGVYLINRSRENLPLTLSPISLLTSAHSAPRTRPGRY